MAAAGRGHRPDPKLFSPCPADPLQRCKPRPSLGFLLVQGEDERKTEGNKEMPGGALGGEEEEP